MPSCQAEPGFRTRSVAIVNIVFSQIELGATDSALSVVTEINTPATSDGTVSDHHDDSKDTTGQIHSQTTTETDGRPVPETLGEVRQETAQVHDQATPRTWKTKRVGSPKHDLAKQLLSKMRRSLDAPVDDAPHRNIPVTSPEKSSTRPKCNPGTPGLRTACVLMARCEDQTRYA